MKKTSFLILFGVMGLFIICRPVYGWLDCPYGKINDPFPGSCFRYIDTNNNQICDHSEPAKENAGGVLSNTSSQQEARRQRSFIFWPSFLTLSLYFLHWYLVYKTKLKEKSRFLNQLNFRFFWNLVLLITFLITGISGLILAFGVLNKTLSFWHNYAGLVFIIVGFFHFLNHLQYFKKPV